MPPAPSAFSTMLFHFCSTKSQSLTCEKKKFFNKSAIREEINSKMYLDFSYMGVGTNSLGYSRKEVDKEVLKKISLGNMSTLNAPEEVFLSEKLLNQAIQLFKS